MEQLIQDIEHWTERREKLLILKYIHMLHINIHEAGDGSRINLSEVNQDDYNKIHAYAYRLINPIIEEFNKQIQEDHN
jgi:hypothetical protein